MDWTIEPSQMQAIQTWLDGGTQPPKETLEAYFRLGEAIRRKLLQDTITATSRANRLNERLESYRQREKQEALEGNFDCLGIDTIDLAKAVLYVSARQGFKIENKTRFRLLVYAVYCAWLGGKEPQRVTIEHPVAQPAYGPCLQSMLDEKKITYLTVTDGKEYRNIAELNPGLAATIKNVVKKYMSYSLQDVKTVLMGKNTPFKKIADKCLKEGVSKMEIPDKDIYLWKREHD